MTSENTHWRFSRKSTTITLDSREEALSVFWAIMALGPLHGLTGGLFGEAAYLAMVREDLAQQEDFRDFKGADWSSWMDRGIPEILPARQGGFIWEAGGASSASVIEAWGGNHALPNKARCRGITLRGCALTFLSGRDDGKGSAVQWGWAVEAGALVAFDREIGEPAHPTPLRAAGPGSFRGDPTPVREL